MKISPRNITKVDPFSDKKTIQLSAIEVERLIDLGFKIKIILMQPDSLKVAEQILKIVRKMNTSTFRYQQKCISFIEKLKVNALKNTFELTQSTKPRLTEKDVKVDNLQSCRHQLIQMIVQQLSNARQDSVRIEQIDPTLSFSNMQQNSNILESQSKESFSSISMIRRESEDSKIQQMKKLIVKMQGECKQHKKLFQDSSRLCLQKDEKIQTLRTKISKLQQHIIRQVKVQGHSDQKIVEGTSGGLENQNAKLKMQNEATLIKSQALQRQVIILKKQIQTLKINLTQSLSSLKKKKSQKSDLQEKQNQYLALSREYATIKDQVSLLINEKKHLYHEQDSISDVNQDHGQEDTIALRAELQIMKQKYKALQKIYYKLKQQIQRKNDDDMVKISSQLSIPSTHQLKVSKQRQNKQRKKSQLFTPKNQKSSGKKTSELYSDDEQSIIREIRQINKIQVMSQSLGINSFDSIINPNQLSAKIPGFEFNNSIIHKINLSKFVQSFQSKLSFVLQYMCLLELYFNKNFRNSLSQEMMLQETVTIKPLTIADINPSYFTQTISHTQEGSFTAGINTSKVSGSSLSSNRMFINNQFSISQYAKTAPYKNENKQKVLSFSSSVVSIPGNVDTEIKKPSKHMIEKVKSIQQQFKQIASLIPNEYLNPHQLGNDPQFLSRIFKLKHNTIAIIIGNLVKQNEVFKKCLNQMIKNEQNSTKINHDIYFDQDGTLRRRSNSNLGQNNPQKKPYSKENDNCSLM